MIGGWGEGKRTHKTFPAMHDTLTTRCTQISQTVHTALKIIAANAHKDLTDPPLGPRAIRIQKYQIHKINNEKLEDKILEERIKGNKKYSIKSTPTVFINEKEYEGKHNYQDFKKAIKKFL